MYRVKFKVGKEQIADGITELNKIVSKVGTDGAILKWFDKDKCYGYIIYYNEILALVEYDENIVPEHKYEEEFLKNILEDLDRDDFISMVLSYNRHFIETPEGDREDILGYMTLIWKK